MAAALAVACSSPDGGTDTIDRSQSAIDPDDQKLGGSGGGASSSSACDTPGATRACGSTGTQTCTASGEIRSWGACVGDTVATPPPPSPAAPPPVADAGDAGPASQAGACAGGVCKPGSVRYCDDDIEDWHLQQKWLAVGQWSACAMATTSPAGAGPIKNKKTCMANKLCCQEDEGAPFVDYGTGACAALGCP